MLQKYNQDDFHLKDGLVAEGVMRYFAREFGYGEKKEFRGIVGLLHDLDFERFPEAHCRKEQEILQERDVDERIVHGTASHGYVLTVEIEPEHEMEKVFYAVDELTGLIGAVAIMRPSRSVSDLELKKYKDKKFSTGYSREVIERERVLKPFLPA